MTGSPLTKAWQSHNVSPSGEQGHFKARIWPQRTQKNNSENQGLAGNSPPDVYKYKASRELPTEPSSRAPAAAAPWRRLPVGAVNFSHGQVGQSHLVNPDLASEKDLLALPHMNAAVVKSILEQRPFLKMANLHALLSKTLSKEQLADLYGKMFVQINMNTASDEEILLIPGAGSDGRRF